MEITRGDTLKLKFQRKNKNGEVITTLPDAMCFTVKRSYYSEEVLIQKKLSDGTITFNNEDNYYYFTIEAQDTDKLQYTDYVYDIEVITGDTVKTIVKGTLSITKEVTFAVNRRT